MVIRDRARKFWCGNKAFIMPPEKRLMLPGMIPPRHRKNRRALEVAQLANLNATGAHTYTSVNLGQPSEDRIIVCAGSGSGNAGGAYAVSGVTCGGVAMNLTAGPSNRAGSWIAWLKVVAGTSANIVVTTTGANCNIGGFVLSLTGFELDAPQFTSSNCLGSGGNATVNFPAADWTTKDWVIVFAGNSGAVSRNYTFATKQNEFTAANNENWGIYQPTVDAVAAVEQVSSGGGTWHGESMIIWR